MLVFRQLNPGSCRTYLLGREGSGEAALIDPVLEHTHSYLGLLERERLLLTHAVDTHTHADHISAGPALKDVTGCHYVMHGLSPSQCVTLRVSESEEHRVAGVPVVFMHTPGHARDSVCLLLSDRVLTGDTLFLDDGGAGRDDLPGGDPGQHWESLQRIAQLPDELIVYPAHEYRHRSPSSLGEQKQRNPHLSPRSRQGFVDYLEALRLGPADWMLGVIEANQACARDPRAAWIPVDSAACEVQGTLAHGANDLQATAISVGDFKQQLDAGRHPIILDVREPAELTGDLGHLPGIKHIPIVGLSRRVAELEGAEEEEIVTVCRSGGRAATAAQILQQAGFRRVRVLDGGMTQWRSSGFPVEKGHSS